MTPAVELFADTEFRARIALDWLRRAPGLLSMDLPGGSRAALWVRLMRGAREDLSADAAWIALGALAVAAEGGDVRSWASRAAERLSEELALAS